MRTAEFPRARPVLATCGLWLLAAALAGCSEDGRGTVASTPKGSPEVVQEDTSKKAAAAPRVPRGPNQAKALQEAKGK
jgi:hypothetical protein